MLPLLYLVAGLSAASACIILPFWVGDVSSLLGATAEFTTFIWIVVAIAAGLGSVAAGPWADHHREPRASLLRAFGWAALLLAAITLVGALLIPHLGPASALFTFSSLESQGWYHIAPFSSILRGLIVGVLVVPSAGIGGATVTILIRFLLGPDLKRKTYRVGLLIGSSLLLGGAVTGAVRLAVLPSVGVRGTEILGAALSVTAAAGAFWLASVIVGRVEPVVTTQTDSNSPSVDGPTEPSGGVANTGGHASSRRQKVTIDRPAPRRELSTPGPHALAWTAASLALCGVAIGAVALVWSRHFTLLLGAFQSVSTLVLAVALCSAGLGSLAGAGILRITARPAQCAIVAVAVFASLVVFGIAYANIDTILVATNALTPPPNAGPLTVSAATELWLNGKPILGEIALPAVFIALVYPLAHGIVQQSDELVGYRTGVLTGWLMAGLAGGSLLALLSLPVLGLQGVTSIVAILGALAAIPFDLATRGPAGTRRVRSATVTLVGALIVAAFAISLWVLLPGGDLLARSMIPLAQDERLLSVVERPEAIVAVSESPSKGRTLITDDRGLAAANRVSRRAVRAMVHLPLILNAQAHSVVVIGFGVGHAAAAAALHPSVERIDVVDPSRAILADADFFRDANNDVLADRRVRIQVNDGREHLRMQPASTYDLIAVEPPPLSSQGAGAWVSREFYALAHSRLTAGGYFSEGLPLYQVPTPALFSIIRAFVDVFPQAVLLGATDQDLLLVGRREAPNELDPDRVTTALATAPPALRTDLQGLGLATLRDVLSTFLADPITLAQTSEQAPAATDSWPVSEFVAWSRATDVFTTALPASLLAFTRIAAWCPRCPSVAGLDASFGLLHALYTDSLPPSGRPGDPADPETARIIDANPYLRDALAQQTARRNARGVALAASGNLDQAMTEFAAAVRLNPSSAEAHWNLGRALASKGQPRQAVGELRRAVELNPKDGAAHYDLASTLLDLDDIDGAIDEFRAALVVLPNSIEVHNNLGIALGRKGLLSEAIGEFQQALKINPENSEARHNLEAALQAARSAAAAR